MASAVRRASFLDTAKTVLAAFIGVRRRHDHERARVNPVHVVVLAVLFVIAFIFTLRAVVRIVVG